MENETILWKRRRFWSWVGSAGEAAGSESRAGAGVRFKAEFHSLWGGSGSVSLPDSPLPADWALAHGERCWGDSELQSMVINSMITNERERGRRKYTEG